METLVSLKIIGIECYYGSIKALDNVSFSVGEGEFVGILGPNGSGKTTALRAIGRTLRPKVGTVFLDDKNIYDMKNREVAKNVAVVPQESIATFDFTALDIVLMGRNPYIDRFGQESRQDLAVAKRVMELTNTWHFAQRLVSELSGGEKQRVTIARALTQEPRMLLLDEPTTHLDICSQLEIMDLLKQLCKTKKLLIIAVFHDFNLAARYCDSIILLKKGKIVSVGESTRTLTSPNIKKVFNVDTIVKRHPVTGTLHIIPISRPQNQQEKSITIHVICGGGMGSSLMRILKDEGYTVTAGVLNLLDTDYETAQMLKIPTTSEAPFFPITEEAHRSNLKMISKTDVLVIAPIQFGEGNLSNLEAAEKALEMGIPTIILEDGSIQERDFTKGKATNYIVKLKNSGAITVQNPCELLQFLDTLEKNNNKESHQKNQS
jgi:iron complex transport system ATP-binding protein